MRPQFEPIGREHLPYVRPFNDALDNAGADSAFRLIVTEGDLAADCSEAQGRRWFVLRDERRILAATIIQWQPFRVADREHSVANLQTPVSLALADPGLAHIPLALFREVETRFPLVFAAGMGGVETPLPRILRGLRWHVSLVPFFFSVRRAGPFLRNLQTVRTTAIRRLLLDALSVSGLPQAALALHSWTRPGRRSAGRSVGGFGTWADDLWGECGGSLSLGAVRDAAGCNWLYPEEQSRVQRWVLGDEEKPRAWVTQQTTQLREHRYFGDLTVTTLLDALAVPNERTAALRMAVETADRSGASLVIANHSHRDWQAALKACGFWQARSNYAVALSKALVIAVKETDPDLSRLHITRGDADGRINL